MDLSALAVTVALTAPGTAPADSMPSVIADSSAAQATEPAGTTAHRRYNPLTGFGSDLWYVATSPARVNRISMKWIGSFVGGTALLFAYDQEILDAFQRNRDEPVYREVMDVGGAIEPIGIMGHAMPYYLGAAALGWSLEQVAERTGGRGAGRWARPLQYIPLEIVESHLIAGGIRNGAKLLIGRRRPTENRGPRYFELNGGTSFTSGHTSVAFEIATILARHIRRTPVTWGLYGLASTVALQRIDSAGHWPSDILLSAVTGTLVARVVVQRNQARRLAVMPRVEDGKGVTGMVISTRF